MTIYFDSCDEQFPHKFTLQGKVWGITPTEYRYLGLHREWVNALGVPCDPPAALQRTINRLESRHSE